MGQTFEPGQYRGRVTRWGLVKAGTGTAQFALTFLPLGSLNAQNPDADLLPCAALERTIFRAITEKTAQWLLQDLKTLFEYPFDRFGPLDPDSEEAFDFHDCEFTASLAYEEYDGKTRERWNFAGGHAQVSGDPMSPAEIRKLDTLFGAAKPKRNSRKQPPTPQPESGTSPAPAPDAIPY